MKLKLQQNTLILISALVLVIGLASYGLNQFGINEKNQDNNRIEKEIALSGENLNTNTTEEEIAAIKKKANSIYTNEQGYTEADFGDGILMVYIPKASFTMGNNRLGTDMVVPEHTVNLSGYWVAKTPTTVGQFRKFVEETGYITEPEREGHAGPFVYNFSIQGFEPTVGFSWDTAYDHILKKYPEIQYDDTHPVSAISWNDAIAYTDWLSKKTGLPFTLPTDAEWEYAARGTDGRAYPWGNEEPDGTRANYADETFDKYFPGTGQSIVHKGVDDGYAITSPVGSFPNGASPFGLLDMAGNVTEWVYDSTYYFTADEITNPICTLDSGSKLMKAGFWAGSAGRIGVTPDEIIEGHNIRSDERQGDDQNSADDHLGFRIAISYTERGK
jgi:formylglycine-generating enzyme required for sulfatase activity